MYLFPQKNQEERVTEHNATITLSEEGTLKIPIELGTGGSCL
jgi:hypothetical protein